MEIQNIKNPKFLKKMNNKNLILLSNDIRKFLIENISKTGGHLSSNLGIVDLTIAIHKVFNAPKDKVIFDVGHQCYTHKILTGRANKFDTLRKYKGISGFQSRKESIYDSYEAGHSSTSLSAALGMAMARDIDKKDYNVIAVIGDGSIGNGIAYEALNHIGDTDTKLIIILNDNEMSISKNVGGLHNTLDKIRSDKVYKEAKNKTKNVLKVLPFGDVLTRELDNIKESFKKIYLKEGFVFEEFGLKYYGPINGHDYNEMITYLNIAKKEKKPVLLHVITEKGKGYKYAENDIIGAWHGVGPFNIKTGEFNKKNKDLISWSEVISNDLIKLTNKDKDIMVITPAMTTGSKLLKYKELYPKNFIDVGIAEEHALVLANALALSGKKPFVSIYSTFLQRGYDELLHDIARMNSNVVIGIDRCGIAPGDGISHQGIYDISMMMSIPNMTIMAPKDSVEAYNMLNTAFNNNGPFAIRYSKENIKYVENEAENIPIGSWDILSKGTDGYLISYGDFLDNALEIKKLLKKDNINLEVINARFIKPIDKTMWKNIIKKDKPIFVYEESTLIGSLGNYLSLKITNKNLKNNIYVFAIEDKFVEHGDKDSLLKELHLDIDYVYDKIKNIIKKVDIE